MDMERRGAAHLEVRKTMADALRANRPREVRQTVAHVEHRAVAGGLVQLEGYATTFDDPYDMDWYDEVVRSGAFDKTLRESDNIFLMGIHAGWPVAGTRVETLKLAPDTHGLHMAGTLNLASPAALDMYRSMVDAGTDKMSIGFQTMRQEWSPDYTQRDLLELRLFEVSVVPFPANPGTSVGVSARSKLMLSRAELAAFAGEVRAGKALSAANTARLAAVLDQLAAADEALDPLRMVIDAADDANEAAGALIAEVLGVADPDAGDADEALADAMAAAERRAALEAEQLAERRARFAAL